MNQTRRKTVSRSLGQDLTQPTLAVVLATALAFPSGSVIARNPANVVLHNTSIGVAVGGITVSPDNESVYVAGYAPGSGLSHLVILNTHFFSITSDLVLTGQVGAVDVAISHYGHKVYVSNFASQTVSIVSTATNTVIGQLSVGPVPLGLAVSPNGKELWVANSGTAPAFNNGTISVFDTATGKAIALINVGGSPTQVVFEKTGKFAFGGAILPDGSSLYVNNGLSTINNLLVKNGTLKDVVVVFPNTVPPGAQQLGQTVLTLDGKFLYVTNPSLNEVSWATTGNDVAAQLSPISVSPG
jgi:YVTN family beta-propeller protein